MCTRIRFVAPLNLTSSDGDVTPVSRETGLGAPIDGVLREYIIVPVHVSSFSSSLSGTQWKLIVLWAVPR
jgi:hypothetical protein